MNHTTNLKSRFRFAIPRFTWLATVALLCLFAGRSSQASAASADKPRTFATPQEAADALIDAAEKFDVQTLVEILGPGGDEIINTGEPARDKEIANQFAAEARTKMKVSVDAKTKRRAFINVGSEAWPFPVPIVKVGTVWSFDSKAGLNEILLRRIGRDELDAIEICRGYVEAQQEYALTKHGDSKVNQYAQKIISTPGTQDGLAWKNADGTWGGPVGENVARAIERGYTNKTEPFHGYFFRVLKGQGTDAPLGQLDYLVNGAMIGGFALIAFPAEYRVTGVKTFIVGSDGVVYQKDLGPKTTELAGQMDRYNPDKTWTVVPEK